MNAGNGAALTGTGTGAGSGSRKTVIPTSATVLKKGFALSSLSSSTERVIRPSQLLHLNKEATVTINLSLDK